MDDFRFPRERFARTFRQFKRNRRDERILSVGGIVTSDRESRRETPGSLASFRPIDLSFWSSDTSPMRLGAPETRPTCSPKRSRERDVPEISQPTRHTAPANPGQALYAGIKPSLPLPLPSAPSLSLFLSIYFSLSLRRELGGCLPSTRMTSSNAGRESCGRTRWPLYPVHA